MTKKLTKKDLKLIDESTRCSTSDELYSLIDKAKSETCRNIIKELYYKFRIAEDNIERTLRDMDERNINWSSGRFYF